MTDACRVQQLGKPTSDELKKQEASTNYSQAFAIPYFLLTYLGSTGAQAIPSSTPRIGFL